ncbi:hypothetical protein D3C81_1964210 [compost metagenome]
MLTVDRQQHRSTFAHGLHEQSAGHDQRFLVSQKNFLASFDRCQGRAQPRRTDNSRHDCIDFRVGSHLTQPFLADQYRGRKARGKQIIL